MKKKSKKFPVLEKLEHTDPNWVDDGEGYKVAGKLELTKDEADQAGDEIKEKYKNFKPGVPTE